MMKRNINDLSKSEKAVLMREEFEKESPFEKLFPSQSFVKIPCEEFYQKFRNKIASLLVAKGVAKEINFPLEELHLHVDPELKDYNFNDGINKVTSLFYDNDQEFTQLYLSFVREFLCKKFDFPFYFQATPTIRIHFPNSKNADHYPRYHTDIGYGHPAAEINFWLNLTKPIGEQKHGFRVMPLADSLNIYRSHNYDFETLVKKAIENKEFNAECSAKAPEVDTSAGEILALDSRCYHSGEPLLNHTRISMDIRIISVADYEKLPIIYQGAGRMKILFAPGGCYHDLSSTELSKSTL